MTENVDLNKIQINVLKKNQYDSIEPADNEIYLLTDVGTTQVFLIYVGPDTPVGVVDGDKYYNTTTGKLYQYDLDDNEWKDIGRPTQEVLYIDKATHTAYACTDSNEFIQISSSSSGSGNPDGITINLNASDKLQAVGTIDKNTGTPKFDWVGTKAEYDALPSYNDRWIYFITNDSSVAENNSFNNVLNRLNKAYAWKYNNNVVYTVPEPEVNYSAYSSVSDSTTSSTITAVSSTTINIGSTVYTRDTTKDSVFVFVPDDTKNQLLSMYDLINAIRG